MNKIVAGRFLGYGFVTFGNTVSLLKGFSKEIHLSKENVRSIELINQEQWKSMFSAVTRGTIGTLLLGLPGLAAGALTTKNKNTFFVRIDYLDDKEPSFAEVNLKMFKRLQIAITRPSLDSVLKNTCESEKGNKDNEKAEVQMDKHSDLNENSGHSCALYCTACGQQIEGNMVFCPKCGSRIRISEEDIGKSEEDAVPEAIPEKDNSGKGEEKPVVSANPERDKVVLNSTAKVKPEGKYTDGRTKNKNAWIRWVICLFFIMGGITQTLTGHLPIVACIGFSLFGIIFSPPVNCFLQEHMESRRKKWIQAVGCIVAFILFSIGTSQIPKKNAKNGDKQESIEQSGQVQNENLTSVQKQIASDKQIAEKTGTNKDRSVTENIQANAGKNTIVQNDSNDSTSFSQESEEKKAYRLKVEEGKKAIYPIPTQKGKGYDKTIARYGVSKIKKINAYMPKVVEIVSRNDSCDKVVNVDVSDNRSTQKGTVMYADCENGQRFYLTEKELITGNAAESVKDSTSRFTNTDYLQNCADVAKNRVNHPSTFDYSSLNSSVYRAPNGRVVAELSCKAKNSYNLTIHFTTKCFYDDRGLVDIEFKEE